MPTLTATVFPDEAYVLLEADWSDTPAAQYARVVRRNTVTGEEVTLRPYIAFDEDGNLLLDCGSGLWWDTEPPLNVSLEYCTYAGNVAVAISTNPFFETNAAGWTATNGTAVRVCSIAHEGSCSLQFTPSGTGFGPEVSQTFTGLAANVETTLSAWVRTAQGWNSVRLIISVSYADGTFEDIQSDVEILDDAEWRFIEQTFIPRTAVTSATLRFKVSGIPPNTVIFNIDEIQATQPQTLATSACDLATVPSEDVWLKSPLNPCDDVKVGLCSPLLEDCEEDTRVSYVGTDADEYAPNTTLLNPVNRRRPIAVNRVRRDATSALRLLAHDCEARDAVLAANEPGDPLLFQAPADYCIEDRYISVGVERVDRLSIDQREDFRLITLPYAVVDRPEGPANGVCGARIRDLCDLYATWAAITIAGLTWQDLLLGEASPSGPGQPDPPAATRTWGEVEAEFASWLAVEDGGTRTWAELEAGL